MSEAVYLAQSRNREYSQAEVNSDSSADFGNINDFVACLIASGCL